VTVHDANEQNGHLYIVMQLVDSGTLKQRLDQFQKEGRVMGIDEVVSIFTQLADALAYAHDQGIIHRDIKPVNVLMDRSGRPILSDFGIAKVLASTQDDLTRPGAGVGTPEYMSPEQCQGGAVDGRADIYALGIMLFEAQTGRTPFLGNNYPALAHSHVYEPPPRPSSINPNISPAIEYIILTALMKNPQQRYQTARDMADTLQKALAHNTPPRGNINPTGNYYGQPGVSGVPAGPSYPRLGTSSRVDNRQSMLYHCMNCHHMNKLQVRYCTRCGYVLKQCAVCNERNPVGNRFCTKCGQPLAP